MDLSTPGDRAPKLGKQPLANNAAAAHAHFGIGQFVLVDGSISVGGRVVVLFRDGRADQAGTEAELARIRVDVGVDASGGAMDHLSPNTLLLHPLCDLMVLMILEIGDEGGRSLHLFLLLLAVAAVAAVLCVRAVPCFDAYHVGPACIFSRAASLSIPIVYNSCEQLIVSRAVGRDRLLSVEIGRLDASFNCFFG